MTDARILTTLPSHPKTKRLIRRLGGDGAWRLVCLILWARDNRPNGDLHGMTDEDIELATDWSGSPGALIDALVQCGFLDGAEGERRVHDWAEHQPWAMGSDDRKLSASWAALCKRHGREGAAKRMPDYAERMRLAEKPDADALRPACDPQETRKRPVSGSDAPLPSPSPSPLPSQELEAIVSADAPTDDNQPAQPSDDEIQAKRAAKAERLSVITREAVAAYNAELSRDGGGLLPMVTLPDSDVRRNNVRRCLKTAKMIADALEVPIDADFWANYFAECAKDDFHAGRGPYTGTHANWRPDFEYLTRPDVMTKIFDKARG